MAQFGYSGEPSVQHAQTIIPDDPVIPGTTSNLEGVVAYSAAYEASMQHATNRTTELYINLADHPQLDALGFSPIARVVSGMSSTVAAFYSGYGEMSDACDLHGFLPCDGPSEAAILQQGNAYLDADFPRLTRIHTAAVVVSPTIGCAPAVHPAPPPAPPPVPDRRGAALTAALLVAFALWACVCAVLTLLLRSERLQRRLRVRCPLLSRVFECLFAIDAAADASSVELRTHDSARAVPVSGTSRV